MGSISPRILFVLGKGGVGRSTVSAALGLAAAKRGERTLVFEWALTDPIAPWFGLAPARSAPVAIAPNLSVANYSLDESLRAYFVDHLHLPRFHRRIVSGRAVRTLTLAAPGIAELMFLGTLWWLTTLARKEAGLELDRVIVDAPATGHGASILDMPETLAKVSAAGLLGREIDRVRTMMHDPSWTGAVVVATPEELAIEESMELVPRVCRALDRPRVGFVNRAVVELTGDPAQEIGAGLAPPIASALATLQDDLAQRTRGEARLAAFFDETAERGVAVLEDLMLTRGTITPRAVAETLASKVEVAL